MAGGRNFGVECKITQDMVALIILLFNLLGIIQNLILHKTPTELWE